MKILILFFVTSIFGVNGFDSPPKIVKQPPTKLYIQIKSLHSKDLILDCEAEGEPEPTYRWLKNGHSFDWQLSERVSQEAGKGTLTIINPRNQDLGTYQCFAENLYGIATSNSVLVMRRDKNNEEINIITSPGIPKFLQEPEFQNAAEGDTVEFRCDATGNPRPNLKWIHNGRPIEQTPANPRRNIKKHKIVIKQLEKSDIGNYGCNASNALGYVYKDVYLNILSIPPEVRKVSKKEAIQGSDVELECDMFGLPKPQAGWKFNGLYLSGDRYSIDDRILKIKNVQFHDSGEYVCLASNKIATVNATGSLMVRERTKIRNFVNSYETSVGKSVTISCETTSDPLLKVEVDWLHNGKLINFAEQKMFKKAFDNSLTITNTNETDSGYYSCVARTTLDEISATATLDVLDIPSPPVLRDLTCNREYAIIEWEPEAVTRPPILHYSIEYSTSFTPEEWSMGMANIHPIESIASVPMSPWVNYTFRVVSHNKIGASKPSAASQICRTFPSVPFYSPDKVEAKGSSPTNLVIKWKPMTEIEHNAPDFHYRISWKRDIPSESYNSINITDWNQTEISLEDQPTFKRYRVKVEAVNEQGESKQPAKEVIGYSGEDVPLDAPQNFTIYNIESNAANFKWNPINLRSVRGNLRGYKLFIWDKFNESWHMEYRIDENDNEYKLDNLEPYTIYFAHVRVFNDQYDGPASHSVQFQTLEDYSSAVENMQAIPLGSSALLLKWNHPKKPNGELKGYNIYYRELDDNGHYIGSKMERNSHVNSSSQTIAKVFPLKPNTKYRLFIRAVNRLGEGEEYSIDTKTISPDTRGKPDKPSIKAETLTSEPDQFKVKVTWLPNFNNELTGSHFYVVYRIRDAEIWQKTDLIKHDDFVILDLTPNEVYEFKSVSVDDNLDTESEILEYPPVNNPVLKVMARTNCAKYIIDIPSILCRTYEYGKAQIGKLNWFQ